MPFTLSGDGVGDQGRDHGRGEEWPIADDDLRVDPLRPELHRRDDSQNQRENQRRQAAAPEGEQLVAELAPFLPDHRPDIARHESPPRETPPPGVSEPIRPRNASSRVARARRTSSTSTSCCTRSATIGAGLAPLVRATERRPSFTVSDATTSVRARNAATTSLVRPRATMSTRPESWRARSDSGLPTANRRPPR